MIPIFKTAYILLASMFLHKVEITLLREVQCNPGVSDENSEKHLSQRSMNNQRQLLYLGVGMCELHF